MKTKNHRDLIQITVIMVDDVGLEPATFRTSSGCSTS